MVQGVVELGVSSLEFRVWVEGMARVQSFRLKMSDPRMKDQVSSIQDVRIGIAPMQGQASTCPARKDRSALNEDHEKGCLYVSKRSAMLWGQGISEANSVTHLPL